MADSSESANAASRPPVASCRVLRGEYVEMPTTVSDVATQEAAVEAVEQLLRDRLGSTNTTMSPAPLAADGTVALRWSCNASSSCPFAVVGHFLPASRLFMFGPSETVHDHLSTAPRPAPVPVLALSPSASPASPDRPRSAGPPSRPRTPVHGTPPPPVKRKRGAKRGKDQRCGNCFQLGHNRRSCDNTPLPGLFCVGGLHCERRCLEGCLQQPFF